jgi:twinkle protein
LNQEAESEFVSKESCPECGSRDNLARYSDGHGYCFGCHHYEPADGQVETPRERTKLSKDLIPVGTVQAIPARKLTEETCRKWGYSVSELNDKAVQVANYRDTSGLLVAQKIRFRDKSFRFLGDAKMAGLYGQHLWRDGGKRVVVVEGEIDALSVSQVQGNKWPVVSVPAGAPAAKKALQKALQWLLGFEEIVLMFDDDEPGQDAMRDCVGLFPPGRCKIARIDGYKDASDALVDNAGAKIVDAIFGAKVFRPDGIVTIADVKADALTPTLMGLPWFSPILNHTLYGRRLHEIIAIGAGTGVGKTELLAKQIHYDLTVLNEPVGVFLLEQQPADTVKRLASTHKGKQFHVPNRDPDNPVWTAEELADAIAEIEDEKLFMYDSFGATDWEVIKTTIRFLAHSEGIRLFYLDHLTALAAMEEDERKGLERIMAEMGALVQELPITIHLVSHLATPEGKPHEEGGRVMIRHFKGSRSIGFWCVTMLGLERDQQHKDESLRCVTTVRVLKHRPVGAATGRTVFYRYDLETGRYVELDHDPFEEQNDAEDYGFTPQSTGDEPAF